MPRKVNKKKIKKLPKKKVFTIIPPKLKPCQDCGYKSGSAFSIPFGYADLLGMQRLQSLAPLGASTQPTININLAKPMEHVAHIPIRKTMETQTEPKKKYPSVIYSPLEEGIISLEPVQKDIVIKKGEPFVGFEDVYNSPFGKMSNVSIGETKTTGETVSEIAPPPRRVRRTDVEVVADIMVKNENKSYDEAIAAALELSKSKGALKKYKKENK
jgi:hypothetical protein